MPARYDTRTPGRMCAERAQPRHPLRRDDGAGGAAPDGEPGAHVVSFVMPAGETLESLPVPDDARVTLRAVPEELGAALRYSGRWTETGYRQRLAQLEQALSEEGVRAAGTPRWARFDPPWTPWFLRRNEVVVPIEAI
jgi:hypothetical protein